jgi:hypothetical protein
MDAFVRERQWVIHKTKRKLLCIPIDQAYEQENILVKASGGAIGLMDSPSAFRRWMLAGPELSRLQREFDSDPQHNESATHTNLPHHEHGLATQTKTHRQVNCLAAAISNMGNPFLDDFDDLVTLDTRQCASPSVVAAIRTLEDVGSRQYEAYVKNVISERTHSIHAPIKKNSFALFKTDSPTTVCRRVLKEKGLKYEASLFGQLYVRILRA